MADRRFANQEDVRTFAARILRGDSSESSGDTAVLANEPPSYSADILAKIKAKREAVLKAAGLVS